MEALERLDKWQRQAALADGHCLVLAGPGSGKTTLLAARAQRLLAEEADASLGAVSFTRDSAGELAARIGEADRVWSGTFHSLALRQRTAQPRQRNRILDEAGRMHYIRRAIQTAGPDMPLDAAVQAIDRFKATLAPPPTGTDEGQVFRIYQASLRKQGLMDFADILLDCVKGMQEGVVSPLPVKWLLVDEAQDMDEVQYAWIKAHFAVGIAVTLVADDDQSIYGWRHAMGYRGLTQFERETGAKRLLLEANYRCGQTIVATSQHVIVNNATRFAKTLRAQRPDEGVIETRAFATVHDEARDVVATVADNPGQWGILARTNRRLDGIELACSVRQIPFFRLGAGSFWDHPVSGALLALLEDLDAGQLKSGLDRIAVFIDGVTRQELNTIHQHGRAPSCKALKELLALSPDWMELAQSGRVGLLLQALTMWAEHALHVRNKKTARPALSFISGLNGTAGERVAWIRRTTQQSRKRTKDGQVILASLHASKGLEWPHVWIVGSEDGVIPHTDSDIAEERRLWYVGMTRARDVLIVSHTLEGAVASRFISEFD